MGGNCARVVRLTAVKLVGGMNPVQKAADPGWLLLHRSFLILVNLQNATKSDLCMQVSLHQPDAE